MLGERLRASQWAGLALSFAGVALAIGVPQPNVDANVLYGDILIVCGGALWAVTTLVVKATPLIRAPAEKGLGYQVAVSIPIFVAAAWFRGETITHMPSALSLSLMAYQAFWVVGLTFVIWFALVVKLFGQQALGLHLHHAAVRRGGELLHHARRTDGRLRRRGAAGDYRALSRQQAGIGARGSGAGSECVDA